jgi:hypothetical protein
MKLLCHGLVAALLVARTFAAPDLKIDVDAREISRSLLHATIEIPAQPGAFVVWYPKWIPGIHAPGGTGAESRGAALRDRKRRDRHMAA